MNVDGGMDVFFFRDIKLDCNGKEDHNGQKKKAP